MLTDYINNFKIPNIVHGPLEQFQTIPLFFKINFNFSNFSLFYCLCALTIVLFGLTSILKFSTNITRMEIISNRIGRFLRDVIIENVNSLTQGYSIIILMLFNFILIGNLTGLLPFASTITSIIIYTFFWSLSLIIAITLITIQNQKLNYFNSFLPNGTPIIMIYLLVIIEFISFVTRALSLAVRLTANMFAGHTLLKILISFSWYLLTVANTLSIFTFFMIVLIFLIFTLEFLIAFLQTYVYTLLFSQYLNGSISAH